MAFTKYYPSGTSDGVVLPAAAVNHIDTNQSRALDAYAGGDYTASGQIRIQSQVRFDDMYLCAVAPGNSFFIQPGGYIELDGQLNISPGAGGGSVRILDGGDITGYSGGTLSLNSGCSFYLANSGDASFLTYVDDITIIPAATAVLLQGFVRTDDTTLTQDATPNQADHFTVPVPLTPAATVTKIRVHLDGVFGHGGEIQYPPKVRLYEIDTVGAQTQIDEQVDPELVSGNYENDHYFDLSNLTQTMGEIAKSYQVRVYGEGGTNALAGTQFNAIRIFYQVSTWARY